MSARHVWAVIYAVSAVLAALKGYQGLAPERTPHTNSDWVFVSFSFVLTGMFPLGAMWFSRRWGVDQFRRPSLDRHPFGWWSDTLQPVRVSLVVAAFCFIGACFALPHTDHRDVMILWFYAAVALGLFIRERLVYRVYGHQIA